MNGYGLQLIYERLKLLGLVKTERHFSIWLHHGPDYLRDHRRSGGCRRITPTTVFRLRQQLAEISKRVPPVLAAEIDGVTAIIDRNLSVARFLAR